eukprot:12158212-Karenia_brevis.AAC.1
MTASGPYFEEKMDRVKHRIRLAECGVDDDGEPLLIEGNKMYLVFICKHGKNESVAAAEVMHMLLQWKGYHSEVKHLTLDDAMGMTGGCQCWDANGRSNDVVDIWSMECLWDSK